MRSLKVKNLTIMAMLAAIYVVLIKFLCVMVAPNLRVSFGYIPIAVCGMLFGPAQAACVAAVGDLAGAILFPQGALFPGYTATAALTGLIYGLFLRKETSKPLVRILIAQALVAVICNVALNTLWGYLLRGAGTLAGLPARLLKNAVQYPVDVLVLAGLWKLRMVLEKAVR